jgi:hypothetical protein
MAKKTKTADASAEPKEAALPTSLKMIPLVDDTQAPFIYCDSAPTFGVSHGIVHITLEAVRYTSDGTTVARDRIVVGHLRMSLTAAGSLKNALEATILIAQQNPGAAHS